MKKMIVFFPAMLVVLAIALPAMAESRFEFIDKNDDRLISQDELEAAFPGQGADAFLGMDTNGDGAVNHREWIQGHYALKVGESLDDQSWKGWHKDDDMPLILHGTSVEDQNQRQGANQGILPPP